MYADGDTGVVPRSNMFPLVGQMLLVCDLYERSEGSSNPEPRVRHTSAPGSGIIKYFSQGQRHSGALALRTILRTTHAH